MGFSRSNRIGALLIALQPDLAQGAVVLTGNGIGVYRPAGLSYVCVGSVVTFLCSGSDFYYVFLPVDI